MNTRLRLYPIVLASLLIIGCEGAEGPVGPPGSVAISSVTFTLPNANSWTRSGEIEAFERSMPEITQAVASAGAVLAYTDIGSGEDRWIMLPFSITTSGLTSSLNYAYETGTFIALILKNTTIPLADVYRGFRVRVLIIPPSEVPRLGSIDRADYERVLEVLRAD